MFAVSVRPPPFEKVLYLCIISVIIKSTIGLYVGAAKAFVNALAKCLLTELRSFTTFVCNVCFFMRYINELVYNLTTILCLFWAQIVFFYSAAL